MRSLPLETQTLYAELLEHLIAVESARSVGRLGGTVTEKHIRGETYLYWQASVPGGKVKQFYLGPKSRDLTKTVEGIVRKQQGAAPDITRARRLVAQLRVGGINKTDSASGRVIRSLADAGVFHAGAVLVGTHAFVALGNLLGVSWESGSLRTQDVDLATSPEADIDVAVPEIEADIPSILESLAMGFLPVPPLNPKRPSTSFKVRGQSLRVDLLAPRIGKSEAPIPIPRFKAAAEPLDFLGYILESPERAAVIDGDGTLVNVPAPARFGLHKLVVSTLRTATFQTKAEKDVLQAIQVLDAVVELRAGDIALAWEAIAQRGKRWVAVARRGLARLRARAPELHASVLALTEQ